MGAFVYTPPPPSAPSSLSTVKRANLATSRISCKRLPGWNTTFGLRSMVAVNSSGVDAPELPTAMLKLPKSPNRTNAISSIPSVCYTLVLFGGSAIDVLCIFRSYERFSILINGIAHGVLFQVNMIECTFQGE